MNNSIAQYMASVVDAASRINLQALFNPIGDRLSSKPLSTAGLVIKAGASPLVKTGAAAFYAIAKGVLVSKAAATDMAALSGTVVNATFNVYCFFIDSAGALTSAMGSAGATLGAVKFPALPIGQAFIGFIVVNPTGTGNFVGGTTALDDATVIPNVAYISLTAGVDPTVLLN